MEASKEYFNLYVEYENIADKGEDIFDTVAYTVLTKNEINHYVDWIMQKSWGEQTIGERKLKVVPANKIKIFDLSKVPHKDEVYKREELLEIVSLSPYDEIPLIEQLKKYGEDVTKKLLGEDLQIFLDQLEFERQIEQRGINAETDETGSLISEGKMKRQAKSGSSIKADLTGKSSPFFPKEFEEGILDSAVDPAFKVEKIAAVFANHLKNLKHENGQMIGVFGQWGRGKSYFVKQVYEQLEKVSDEGSPFVNIKFQAWKYQSTPSIWAYLFETFIKEYLDVDCWWNRMRRTAHLSVVRKGKWETWGKPLLVLLIGILWFLLIPFLLKFIPFFTSEKLPGTFEEVSTTIKWLGGAGAISFVLARINSLIKFANKPALRLFNSLSKVPSFRHVLGIQEEIHKELVFLIKAWNKYLDGKRLLLFIDDLDRCSHHSLIEIVDSLRVMLDDEEINKHVLVLMALDEDKLQRVIHTKYENLFKEDDELETIAIEYLDKLFISAIKLYPISDDERAEYIKKIADQINPEETGMPKEKTSVNEKETKSIADEHVETESLEPNENKEEVGTEKPVGKEDQSEVETFQNLNESEINTLSEKIKRTNKELTPRQIRIVVYRYLLARNLWLAMAKELEFKTDDVLDVILQLSDYRKEDKANDTKINPLLFSIVRMVVAY